MMKFSWAISRVKWLSGELTAQPFDPADSPRELHHMIFHVITLILGMYKSGT
jgi:hypothetical protein